MAWYLDGKNLSTLAWNIKDSSSSWAIPAKTGENVRVPNRHGSFWTKGKTYGEGHLTLNMWAQGCEADGSLPITEDGRRKTLANLDALTGLFSQSRRLLTLRKTTGSELPLVNELSNPTMTSKANSGMDLAVNAVVDADLKSRATTTHEISRDLHPNPLMVGRTGDWIETTEDLYPDPFMRQHRADPATMILRSYYYPIKQNVSGVNQFATMFNGFEHRTGVNGTGVINFNRSTSWPNVAYIGEWGRQVSNHVDDKQVFFIRLRLAAGSPQDTLAMRIVPYISLDGEAWTAGTTKSFTASKSYQWVVIQPSDLPTLSTKKNGYYVKYRLDTAAASSWVAGPAINIDRLAIQDGPPAGNPWVSSLTTNHMIVGNDTSYIWYSGTTDRSWSVLKRPKVNEWEVIDTGSKATTAPYTNVWGHMTSYPIGHPSYNESWLAFTSFGGKSTFRRTLPAATRSYTDTRIWGKLHSMTPSATTFRVMERGGSAGAYTYTQLAEVTTSSQTFISPKFSVTAGRVYVVEIDVPASDAGFEPAVFLREMHVSNAASNTRMWVERTVTPLGLSGKAVHTGDAYTSTILGMNFKSPGIAVGLPRYNSRDKTTSNIGWTSQPRGVHSVDGVVQTERMVIANPMNNYKLTLKGDVALGMPDHLTGIASLPPIANVGIAVDFYNSSGTLLRTQNLTVSGVRASVTKFSYDIATTPDDYVVQVKFTYEDPSRPLAGIIVSALSVYTNLPTNVNSFSGNSLVTSNSGPKTSSWVGVPYFSQSVLTTELPQGWSVNGLAGIDADRHTIQFAGNTLVVPAQLVGGTAVVGLKRGSSYPGDMVVSVTPEGGTSTSLGTITSTKDFVQATVAIPASGSSYLTFTVTGGSPNTVSEVEAIQGTSIYPTSLTSWVGFTLNRAPAFSLPVHPSSRFPRFAAIKRSDGTTAFTSGDVLDWDGPVLSGGYLQIPVAGTSYSVTSSSIPVTPGYASAAVKLLPSSGTSGMITFILEGASAANRASGVWTTLDSKAITLTSYGEVKINDAQVTAGIEYIRLRFLVNNASSSATGTAAIIDGVTLTPSVIALGSAFPGVFTGAKSISGQSYNGNIRQCYAEVTEAIDMSSMAYGNIAEFSVALTVPGAFWEDIYDTEAIVEAPGGTSGTLYLTDFAGATAPMTDLVIDVEPVSGTLTRFSLTDKGSGSTIEYNGGYSDSRITINNVLASVSDSKGQSVIRYVTRLGDSSMFPITPFWRDAGESLTNHVDGSPAISWTANVPIRITVSGRRKYLIG